MLAEKRVKGTMPVCLWIPFATKTTLNIAMSTKRPQTDGQIDVQTKANVDGHSNKKRNNKKKQQKKKKTEAVSDHV